MLARFARFRAMWASTVFVLCGELTGGVWTGGLTDHAELGLRADPVGRAHVLASGALEAVQILRQGRVVELGEELGTDRKIELADLIDELTFVHDSFTFTKRGVKLGSDCRVLESDKFQLGLETQSV